jgi:hypothetical protein
MNQFQVVADGDIEGTRKLFMKGADINAEDCDGNTVMHIAARNSNVEMIKELAHLGVDINTLNFNGWTPIYVIAFSENSGDAVTALVKLGADANIVTPRGGWSPILIATQKRHNHTVHALILSDVNLDVINNGGITPVYLAACLEHWDICFLLASAGADIAVLSGVSLPSGNPILTMLERFHLDTNITFQGNIVPKECHFISMVKLLASILPHEEWTRHSPHDDDDDDDGNIEKSLAKSFQSLFTNKGLIVDVIEDIFLTTDYSLRRRLCKLAWRTHSHSPLGSGAGTRAGVVTDSATALLPPLASISAVQQYVTLACLFLHQSMLADVLALRLTCKSNNHQLRFPVTSLSAYQELEERLIESFVAYDASHLVPASLIQSLIDIHCSSSSQKRAGGAGSSEGFGAEPALLMAKKQQEDEEKVEKKEEGEEVFE